MLLGCLIRNFKVYENIVFTPISLAIDGGFSIFTGNNGVGKSSILEAIDHFFNQTGWILNNNSRKEDAFIAPLFFIKKSDFDSNVDNKILDTISNYFWNAQVDLEYPSLASNEGLKQFTFFRDRLKSNYQPDTHYLFLIGNHAYQSTTAYFSTFTNTTHKLMVDLDENTDQLDRLLLDIKNHYSYVYIPIESSTKDILKIESFELQELMDKDVLDSIDRVLNKKRYISNDQKAPPNKRNKTQYSPLSLINESLDNFVSEVNLSIQDLGGNYSFSTEKNTKKNLSAQDIRDRILQEFFSIRTLRKDGKLIEHLSSGEQRIALFDIAYAILSQGKKTKKNLILAIDEPEASMHMSQCYRQFIRLSEISNKYGHQVLITSHWYGFLPVLKHGYINHIDKSNDLKITQHALKNITSSHKTMPDEISLKSMFDLVSSVIGMMRSETANWLICEGVDDQIYYSYFLKNKINNLCLLPIGGIDNVVKLYNYLYAPLSEKVEVKSVSGVVVCIIDTDKKPAVTENPKTIDGFLTLRRLQLESNFLKLVVLNGKTERHITSIEDLLDAKIFFESIKCVVNDYGSDILKQLLTKLEVVENEKYTGFSNNCKSIKGTDLDSHLRIHELVSFISTLEIKYKIANIYIKKHEDNQIDDPEWVDMIVQLFNSKKTTKEEIEA